MFFLAQIAPPNPPKLDIDELKRNLRRTDTGRALLLVVKKIVNEGLMCRRRRRKKPSTKQ